MLLLLPPSETKRDGGSGAPVALDSLAFPELRERRLVLLDALRELAGDEAATARALKLGPTQLGEVARNRRVAESPTMPVLDRFTGVLFDALDATSLDERARAFAHRHVLVQSALFGPVAALDELPAYRLSHDSRVPGLPLKRHWAAAVGERLAERPGLIVDLRSEGYAALGPLPSRDDVVYLRVLSEGESGVRRALNHFNKQSKGRFTRAVLEHGADFASTGELIDWATGAGWRLERRPEAPGELALVV